MTDTERLLYIETASALDEWVGALNDADSIAVDTESDSLHRYREKVCLIQMTALGQDAIIDPLALDDLGSLGAVFADPNRTKIFHDAGYDLVCLARDFDFEFAGLFDTMLASRLLGKRRFGLATVLKEYFGFEADKAMQRSDWAQRPLTTKQLHYARYDTHYLPQLREILLTELGEAGRLRWAEEEFGRLPALAEGIKSRNVQNEQEGFWRIKGVRSLPPDILGRVQALYAVRDTIAQKLDRPPFKVFSNALIVDLARRPPRDLRELGPRPGLRRAGIDRFGSDILTALEEAKPFQGKPPKGVHRRRRSGRFLDNRARLRYESLRELRKSIATTYDLEPEVMLSNAVLEEFARRPPDTLEQVAESDALKGWRSQVFAEPIYACVHDRESQ